MSDIWDYVVTSAMALGVNFMNKQCFGSAEESNLSCFSVLDQV